MWLQAAGYHTVHVGKYLNGYGGAAAGYVPPGWDEWYAASGDTTQARLRLPAEPERHAWSRYGGRARDFKQDVFTDLAVDAIDRSAPARPVLPRRHVHGAARRRPEPQPAAARRLRRARPSRRPATRRFDAEPLPLPPSFNEADVSDKPLAIQAAAAARRRRASTRPGAATAAGSSRCSRSTRASAGSSTRCAPQGELDNTLIVFTSDNGFFAGEHRVRDRQEPRLRGGDPGAAGDPRARASRRASKVDDLAINADLAPTILDAAGAEPGLVEDGARCCPFADHPARAHGRELLIEKGDSRRR